MIVGSVCFVYCSAEMNTVEFLASLEASSTVGLGVLNYVSFWDHLEVIQDMEQEVTGEEEKAEEVEAEEVVVEEEEVVKVT